LPNYFRAPLKPYAQVPTGQSTGRKAIGLLLALAFLSTRDDWPCRVAAAEPTTVASRDAAVISDLVTSEETCLMLAPKMSMLSMGLLNLRLPGPGAELVFASSVNVSDIGPAPATTPGGERVLESRLWPLSESAKEVAQVDLWRPLLDAVSFFEHAKVYVISGEHPSGDLFRFEAKGGFEALAQMKSGEWRSFSGKMKLNWQRAKTSEGKATEWQITGWRTEDLYWNASPKRLFVEALDIALRAPQDPEMLRRSQHYKASVQHYRDGMKKLPHPYFAPISANQKEGLAVADVNGDGFDDIYITVRLGKNMLLRNWGDGTFTEEAALYGLDLPGHTTCALFADFDNDGDPDAILGRSLLKTSYLENRNGRFFQHPIPKFMPMAAISMAAADYNLDGLLDVYICTYRPAAPAGASPAGGVAQVKDGDFDWPDEFLSPELAREYRRRTTEHRQRKGGTVLDQIGPPNVLLINLVAAAVSSQRRRTAPSAFGETPCKQPGATTTRMEILIFLSPTIGRRATYFGMTGPPASRTLPRKRAPPPMVSPWALPGGITTMMGSKTFTSRICIVPQAAA
jgi:hypothetical protein